MATNTPLSDKEFEELVNKAFDHIPELYQKNLNNVAVTIADEPTPAQREKLKLRCNETLFGLYEGIPLTQRGAGYNLVLPDRITIFKLPMLRAVNSMDELAEQVRHTLWHEIAHFYGLNHAQIHKLDGGR
ncbi:MAG TPA: metallopeptidase family protein [Candidatus Saccharimonadales bacterium]|nr:metallopeptidase family protein [Candidatus Saccharimonadales bacterium]